MHQFSIQAGKKSTDPADVWVYGDIGGGWFGDGITAKQVAKELSAVKSAEALNVHINSMGGDVFDGIAIMNLLKGHGAPVIVQVDGIAASAASVIAMAGETITINAGGQMMVHNPWSVSVGDANKMREDAQILDKVSGELAGIYAMRTGRSTVEIKQLMDAETWMNADEAQEMGFATVVADSLAIAAFAGGDWMRLAFPHWADKVRSGQLHHSTIVQSGPDKLTALQNRMMLTRARYRL